MKFLTKLGNEHESIEIPLKTEHFTEQWSKWHDRLQDWMLKQDSPVRADLSSWVFHVTCDASLSGETDHVSQKGEKAYLISLPFSHVNPLDPCENEKSISDSDSSCSEGKQG